jgi:hypothetical protein
MNLIFPRPVRLAAVLALVALTTRLSAAIPPAENLLPADTLFLLTIPDCHALRADLAQSPQTLLWNDPALRPFHDKVMGKLNELFVGPLETDLGVDLGSFTELPQGQFTVAVTRNGWNGVDENQNVGWLLLLDAKEKSNLLATNLSQLRQKWAAAGKSIRTETVHGIAFSIVPLSTNDIPAAISGLMPGNPPMQELGQTPKLAKPAQMVIGQFESLLIAGNSIKAVEPVVARLTGGSVPSLADNSQFEEDKASQFRDSPLYYSWLNAHAWFDVLARIPAPEANPEAPTMFPVPSAAMILNASGLMGLKSVSLSYHESHEGATATLYLSVPEASRQGLLKILATPQKDASPPPFVPADAVKFWRWRLDGQKMWAELQKSLAVVSPALAGSLDQFIDVANTMARQRDAGFDLRRDLIGNLGDDWMSYDKNSSGSAGPGIFLFAVANPEQTLLAIKTATALYSPQEGAPAPQEFLGHTIYALAMRPQMSPNGATSARSLYCTIGSGYIAMSGDISDVQDFLRSAGKPPRPLAQLPGLADAVQHIGGMGNGLFGYQDNRDVMQTTFNNLKQPDNSGAVGQSLLAFLPKSFADMLDYSLLPDYNQVSKYFYFSVFTGATTPQGISFRGFYPRPPLLN